MTIEQNDPTISGFTPPTQGNVRLSGNETEMLCLKAARGAGLSWGLAEEAGFAARWLQRRGIDGPTALLAHLDRLADGAVGAAHPVAPDDLRPRGGGTLCPIATGATLSDSARIPATPVGPLAAPILFLPFLQCLAQELGRSVLATWQDGRISISPEGEVTGPVGRLSATATATLDLTAGDASATEPSLAPQDHRPSPDCLSRLNAYAMKITVPATQSSRVDAGSGTDDND